MSKVAGVAADHVEDYRKKMESRAKVTTGLQDFTIVITFAQI